MALVPRPRIGAALRCRVSTTGPHCPPSSGRIKWCRHSMTLELGTTARADAAFPERGDLPSGPFTPHRTRQAGEGRATPECDEDAKPQVQCSMAGEQDETILLLDEEHLEQNEVCLAPQNTGSLASKEEFLPPNSSGGLESGKLGVGGASLPPEAQERTLPGLRAALLGSWPHRCNPGLCHHAALSSSKDTSHWI